MTPILRAVQVVDKFSGWMDKKGRENLIEAIRVAIVEATNEELDKRRAAERRITELENKLGADR